MTPEALAALVARHVLAVGSPGRGICACGETWPCDAARLAEVVGEQAARLKRWEDEETHEAMSCYHNERDLSAALERERVLRESADEIAAAAKALVESLGEYVRQSMYANPEWRDGVRRIEAALLKQAREALALAPEPGREGDRE